MNDDFNTPIAVAALFDLASEINRSKSPRLARQLRALGGDARAAATGSRAFLARVRWRRCAEVERLISSERTAKKAKNFAEADRVRKVLLAKGIVLEDGPGGTTWRRRSVRCAAPGAGCRRFADVLDRAKRALAAKTDDGTHHRAHIRASS